MSLGFARSFRLQAAVVLAAACTVALEEPAEGDHPPASSPGVRAELQQGLQLIGAQKPPPDGRIGVSAETPFSPNGMGSNAGTVVR